MTEEQFINSWSKELSAEFGIDFYKAKMFIMTFYSKAIGFKLSEITEGEIDRIAEKYSSEILPNEKDGSQSRCGLEVGFIDGFKYCINLLKDK